MNYEFRNNDVQRIYSSEEVKVIDRCNCCRAILPNGDTQYYNYCWRCDTELTMENVSVVHYEVERHKRYVLDMDMIKTIIIDYSSPRYMIIHFDGTIFNGYRRDDKYMKDIERAIREENGEFNEEDENIET